MTTISDEHDGPSPAEFGREVARQYPIAIRADAVARSVEKRARVHFDGDDTAAGEAMLYAHAEHLRRQQDAARRPVTTRERSQGGAR